MLAPDTQAAVEAKLSGESLPVLPANTTRLLRNLADAEIDNASLTRTIELFPSISGRLVALANSAWSSPLEEITSLEQACARLGLAVVTSTSLAMAIASPFDKNKCPEFDPARFWTRAFLTAELATHLYSFMPEMLRHDLSTLRTAGLIHNLGLLLLACKYPDMVGQAIRQKEAGEFGSLQDALLAGLGFGYTHAGHYLAISWSLPPVLGKVLASYPETDFNGLYWEEVNAIGVANSIAYDVQHQQQRTLDDERLLKLGISIDNIQQLYARFKLEKEKIETLASELFS